MLINLKIFNMKKIKIIISILLTSLLATTIVLAATLPLATSWAPLTKTIWDNLVNQVNENSQKKVFYIRSNNSNVGCININYAPTWYTDEECLWLQNGYSFYEWTTQETFNIYSDPNCISKVHTTSRWMYQLSYWDNFNFEWYMKVPVVTWYYNELLCEKWLKQEELLY